MPEAVGLAYQIYQPIYDTVQLTAASNQTVTFFSVPLNGIIAGTTKKHRGHTNMVQTGMLEKGVSITVNAITMAVRELAEGGARPTFVDIQAIAGGWIEIKIGDQNFGYYPRGYLGSGNAELMYFSNITAAATEYHANQGVSACQNRLWLENSIKITEQESIAVYFTVPGTIAAVTDVQLALWGTMTRPVR